MSVPTIAVINESSLVSDDQVKDVVAALQIQVDRDFAAIWHAGASLVCWDKYMQIPVGTWLLLICDNSDQSGALGYHELTRWGDPIGKVFVADDFKDNLCWSVTASHELLEMLADPWINLCAQDGTDFYAYEVCDPCESDVYGYDVTIENGKIFKLSDFVLPDWFQSGTNRSAPFDLRGHITKPLELLPDGYISVFRSASSGGWTQINAQTSSPAFAAHSIARPGSRRYRRRIGKTYWRRSCERDPLFAVRDLLIVKGEVRK